MMIISWTNWRYWKVCRTSVLESSQGRDVEAEPTPQGADNREHKAQSSSTLVPWAARMAVNLYFGTTRFIFIEAPSVGRKLFLQGRVLTDKSGV